MQSDPADRDLEERIRGTVLGRTPGLSVAVVRPAGIVWLRGLGHSDLGTNADATPASAYLWFSMTKIVTATAAMRLVDRGALGLDDRVADHYPPFAEMRPTDRAARVTVRHLLSHSSGITNPIPVRWVHPAARPAPDPEAFLAGILRRHPRLQFEPGTRARYSNVGFLVLGQVIARVSGRPFVEHVSDEILEPLGMADSGFRYVDGAPRAVGYQRRRSPMTPLMRWMLPKGIIGPNAGAYVSFLPFNVDGPAYGGLIGPVEDAARFLQMHLRGGELGGHRILSEASALQMREITTPGKPFDLGLGWFRPARDRGASPAFVQHRGDGGAFANDMRIYPEANVGVVMMGNATSYDRDAVARILFERFAAGR
jgi:CubicO group peptidase (beta-lactamase class C family)